MMMTESLPAVADGGWGWLALMGAFIAQLLYSGAVTLVGIYMVEWQEDFGVGAGDVAIIPTLLFIGLLFTGITGALCRRFGCRPVMLVAGGVASLSSLLASFSTNISHLYIYAVFAGISNNTIAVTAIIVPRFYFKRRLAFANGFVFAGMGCGILVMAPAIERLCASYGWKGAMLIHSAINANYLISGALFRPSKLETRLIADSKTGSPRGLREVESESKMGFCFVFSKILHKIDDFFNLSSLAKNRLFVLLTVVSIFIFCGQVGTLLFMAPMLVNDREFSPFSASIVISVYGIMNLTTRLLHGFLLDYKVISVLNMYLLSLVVSSIALLLSPVVTSLAGHFVLAVIFGGGTGVLHATTSLLCREFVSIDLASNAISLQLAVTGVGIILGSQLMGKLHDATGSYDVAFYINGCLLLGGAVVMAIVTKYLDWKPSHTGSCEDMNASHVNSNEEIGATAKSRSRDIVGEPIKVGYQPVLNEITFEDV